MDLGRFSISKIIDSVLLSGMEVCIESQGGVDSELPGRFSSSKIRDSVLLSGTAGVCTSGGVDSGRFSSGGIELEVILLYASVKYSLVRGR